MIRNRFGKVIAAVVALAVPGAALAQERGRTDGPEGSEYGKGGYSRPVGNFSLTLNWGAALLSSEPLGGAPDGPPLFIGATATYWMDDWFLLDLSPAYIFDSHRVNVLVGPRFRTGFYPLSLNLGVQAGPVILRDKGVRFAISPQVSVDSLIADHYLLGVQYAPDLTFGAETEHRIFMNLGYRF